MNAFVDSRYVERTVRLAAGIEPVDALRVSRIPSPFSVVEEVELDEALWTTLARRRGDPFGEMRLLSPRSTCRHVLLYREGLFDDAEPRVTLRLLEGTSSTAPRRFVPRRVSVPLMDPADLGPDQPAEPQAADFRIWRPHLFPGAAYPIHDSATGLRGRVSRGGEVVRWARIEATNGTGDVVGRAHGDDRGEFLLILGSGAASEGEPQTTLDVTVTVAGPAAAPEPHDSDLGRLQARTDPLWDLPVEVLPASLDVDPVSRGEVLPAGYTTERSWLLEGVPMGRIISERDAFDIA